QRRAARRDRRGLQARLAAALRRRQAQAAPRPGLRLQGPARGAQPHGSRPARRQDRRAHLGNRGQSPISAASATALRNRALTPISYSALMFASFTTLPQVSYSRLM